MAAETSAKTRIGASLFLNGHKLYRWGGESIKTDGYLEEFDLDTMQRTPATVGNEELSEATLDAACVVLNGRAYTFGGFSPRTGVTVPYLRDVYQLDLTGFTRTWQRLPAVNEQDGPIPKCLCGMVSCGFNELFIFGGLGQKADDIPLQTGADYEEYPYARFMRQGSRVMCTNEMHIFNVSERRWTVPHTTGVRPPPCAAFSFTKIDRHRVLLFAGRQFKQQYNNIHILDMSSWHWSGAINQTKVDELWPSPRSQHTAANLINPDYVCPPNSTRLETRFVSASNTTPVVKEQHVLFVWGRGGDGHQLGEMWILHTVSLTWEKIALPVNIKAGRMWHSTATYHPTPFEALVLTMGGLENTNRREKNHPEDVILHFGVRPLYKKCLEAVTSLYPRSYLTAYLPGHIINEIDVYIATLSRLKESSTHYIEM